VPPTTASSIEPLERKPTTKGILPTCVYPLIFAENEDMKKGLIKSKRSPLDSGSWSVLLEVQEESDLSVKDFCASQGVNVASFYQWRKRLLGGKAMGNALFSAIEIQSKPLGGILVELPGGVVLRFSGLPPVEYLRSLGSVFNGG